MAKSKPLPLLKHLGKLVRLAFWDPTRRKTCPPKVGVGPHPEEKPVRQKGVWDPPRAETCPGEGARSRTPGEKYRRRYFTRNQRNRMGALDS